MYNNPYFNPQQRFQPMPQQQYLQPISQNLQPLQTVSNQIGLLGKIVESIDVVKAMDIPLDGSISYFPLTDGTAIVTKQLQTDGTSKTVVYRPTVENKKENVEYLTLDNLEDALNDLQELQDIKEDIKEIKRQLKVKKSKESKEDE